MKKLIIVILVLSAVTFGGVVLSRSISGARGSKAITVLGLVNGQRLHKAELSIEGMWCASCATGAEYSLKEIEGVKDASVGFTDNLDGEGWVVYERSKVTDAQIIKAVEPYQATIVSDTVYTE